MSTGTASTVSTSTVLGRILARTRSDLAQRKASVPVEAVRERATLSTRSFAQALRTAPLSLIAEYKPKSPSRGPIRPDASPEDVVRAYSPYASAVSVLCDEPFFGGGYGVLSRVRAVTTLPLLAKDFVVDEYQVFEARAHGADAILLMASVLEEAALRHLLHLVRSLGMEALVETHDEAELEVALRAGAMVVGVNSRDLRTLEVDLGRARQRLQRVPTDRIRVAESGLRSRSDIEAVRTHADAVLIGSELISAPDPARRIEELGWTCK